MSTYGQQLTAELDAITTEMSAAYATWDAASCEEQPPAIEAAYVRLRAWNRAWAAYAAAGYRPPVGV